MDFNSDQAVCGLNGTWIPYANIDLLSLKYHSEKNDVIKPLYICFVVSVKNEIHNQGASRRSHMHLQKTLRNMVGCEKATPRCKVG